MFFEDFFFNASYKHRVALWIPQKTGTSTLKRILDNYDFKSYRRERNEIFLESEKILQVHTCYDYSFLGDFKILASVRNPYERFVSEYKFSYRPSKVTKDGLLEFIENFFSEGNPNFLSVMNCYLFRTSTPDFFVRIENLFEDLSKIPFIVNDDFYTSGNLEKMTKIKFNENRNKVFWKDLMTKDSADFIYYNLANYFEMFGYDKNSWKN